MPINRCRELSTGCYESSEILPFGPASLQTEGARLKSLHSLPPRWITLEQVYPFPTKRLKRKASLTTSAIILLPQKSTEKGDLPMTKRNKLDFTGQPIYI